MMTCDPLTGACLLPAVGDASALLAAGVHGGQTVHYIGDPMCSWCWGISPTVAAVAAFCQSAGLGFTLTLGGLRAGGGDPWNAEFRDFLRHEWRHINRQTGQPFGFTLLDAPYFDYDTEPACRAVAAVRLLQAKQPAQVLLPLRFFTAVQRKFYVDGQDPKETDFYTAVCAGLEIDFYAFRTLFESQTAKQAVQQDFLRSRQWGVRAFPTLLLERDGTITTLTVGAVNTEQLLAALKQGLVGS
ncbi:DsbA family protein [Serratia ureilytica]|uniref:DsbA family protein n=1 Tax=Serratia ureilytica TaxID=300181 RepID=UPI001D193E9A|nr:DsbA family protein [Serratia ureilytica]MCC4106652.1 DsbA family protein [Serratia ureilytica]